MVLQTRPAQVDDRTLKTTLAGFIGDIAQIPPMYSALKRDGKPLYEYARAGQILEREARTIHIAALDLVSHDGDAVAFRVACSKGTYVRTLAEDIGERLGCGAHLTALRRENTGGFSLDRTLTLAQLGEMTMEQRLASLRPVDSLVAALPALALDAALAARLKQGQRIPIAARTGTHACLRPATALSRPGTHRRRRRPSGAACNLLQTPPSRLLKKEASPL